MEFSNIKRVIGNWTTVSPIDPLPTTGHGTTIEATISSGTALTGEIDLGTDQLVAIQMPAAWDAANLTFTAATASGGTFQDLYDDAGIEVNVTAAASRCIAINANALSIAPIRYLKIRSGTTATPVNQTAARALTLIMKR